MEYRNNRYYDPQIALWRKICTGVIIVSVISIGSNMIILRTFLIY